MNALFNRVSVRSFQNKLVEKEKVTLLLKAAMAAPSAGNQQPWEFYVVENQELLEQLSKSTPYAKPAKGSAVVVIPCYRKEGLRFEECVQQDMSACTQNILIEAVELGLGAVWMCTSPVEERMQNVREIISLPEHLDLFCMIALGYAAEEQPAADRYDESRIHHV